MLPSRYLGQAYVIWLTLIVGELTRCRWETMEVVIMYTAGRKQVYLSSRCLGALPWLDQMWVIEQILWAFHIWILQSFGVVSTLFILRRCLDSIIHRLCRHTSLLHILVVSKQRVDHLLGVLSVEDGALLVQIINLSSFNLFRLDYAIVNSCLNLLMTWYHCLGCRGYLLRCLLVDLQAWWSLIAAIALFSWLVYVMYTDHGVAGHFRGRGLRMSVDIGIDSLTPVVYWEVRTLLMINCTLLSTAHFFIWKCHILTLYAQMITCLWAALWLLKLVLKTLRVRIVP